MSRLTRRIIDEVVLNETGNVICKAICDSMDEYDHPCDMCPINEAIKKLARYEDLEEQVRLIELPCAVGDTVWDIAGAEIREQIVDGIECRTDGFYIYANEDEWLGKINELVFLTKEEAEAKLKELEGDKE